MGRAILSPAGRSRSVLRFLAALGCGILGAGSLAADTLLSTGNFSYTGGSQSYTVPAYTTYLVIKAWGAGGGGTGGVGGGGGFVKMNLPVSPGDVFSVIVGEGGHAYPHNTGAYPNGGVGHESGGGDGGGGGGRSQVSKSGMILVAGAGGGAGCDYDRGGATVAEGGAGGSTGEAGNPDSSNSTDGGPGATQSGGGSNGSAFQGGEGGWNTFPGGGGGDGYYGGGGGAGGPGYPPNGGGGGGGSSYASGGTNISYSDGSGQAVGGSGDANYPGSVGNGGNMISNGQPGYVVILAYQASAAPTIAGGTRNLNQQESVDYAISASGSPAISSYGASGLPSGLSLNTSTGHITGSVATPGTYTSTISATNSIGTSSATLTWVIAAAVIHGYPSVTPGSVFNGGTVQLNSDGTTNFGFGWTENVIWPPSGSPDVLGHFALGAHTNYTPAAGVGTYWYQFRIVDQYANYADEWVSFTVTEVVLPPTTVTVTGTGSYSVSLSWSGASAAGGINHYNVYRNGTLIGTASGTTYTDNTAAAGTSYSYTIKTVDNGSALSAASSAASATTTASLEIFTPLP